MNTTIPQPDGTEPASSTGPADASGASNGGGNGSGNGSTGGSAGPAPTTEPGPTRPQSGGGFFSWLRGLGISRSSSERWFAGVAGGIAARAGIDPLIVRGIFVVLAVLGGPGLVLYLAGWLLLPDAGGRIHAEELVRGRAQPGVIVAAVIVGALVVLPVLIGVIGSIIGGPGAWGLWDAFGTPDWVQVTLGVMWWAVLLPAGVIWLIVWISRGGLRRAPDAANRAAAGAEQASAWAQQAGEKAGAWGQSAGEKAGAWGQQAGENAAAWAQKAGDNAAAWGQKVGDDTSAWAERERVRYESRRPGAAQVLMTFALALMAAGGVAVWALSTGAETRFVFTTALVAAVAVCALSMIVAGVRGRTSGWIGTAALVGAISLVFTPYTSLTPDDLQVRPLGDTVLEVTGDSPAESALAVFAGETTLDLTALDARDAGRTVEVWVFAGNVEIELPATHPTRVTVQVFAGNTNETSVDEETRTIRGPFLVRTTGANLTGAAPEDITEVQVRMFAGNVDIDGTDGTSVAGTGSSNSNTARATAHQTRTLESEATR